MASKVANRMGIKRTRKVTSIGHSPFTRDIESEILYFLDFMNTKIKYGYIDKNNRIYHESELNSKEWADNYQIQLDNRLLKTKIGHCWDFVELERWMFNKLNIPNETYFIWNSKLTLTHTLLIYYLNDQVCYFESAWFKNKGIYKFNSISEFWKYFIPLYSKSNNDNSIKYKLYSKPTFTMNQFEFVDHCIK